MLQKYLSFNFLPVFIICSLPFFFGSSNITDEKYEERFYLSNYTTFSPGSNVFVNLYSASKKNVFFQFRLIKIENPSAFFRQMNNFQSRYNFDIWGKDKEVLLKYTKLIKKWNASINSAYYNGGNKVIDLGKIDNPGIYILQALKDNLVAYCGIVVSDYAMVYKNNSKNLLAFTANSKTGKFSNNVKFTLYNRNKIIDSKFSDKDGLVFFKNNGKVNFQDNSALLIAQTGTETIVSNPYFYFRSGNNENITAYVYTNQPVYRPGQNVFFKAILRRTDGNELINVPDKEFTITIKSPRNKIAYTEIKKTNELGTLNGYFMLDENSDLGNYTIQLSSGNNNYYGSFSVEEYKKPEFFVKINTNKNNYAAGDEIRGTVSAEYYFGSPVQNANVTLNIYRRYFWRPWWYWSEYAWFYRSFNRTKIMGLRGQQLIKQLNGEFDKNGNFQFNYIIEKNTDADFEYILSADITDYSRRSISGSKEVFVTRGSFTISTSPDKYFIERRTPVKIKVNTSDFSDKPVETNFKIEITYPSYSRNNANYNQPQKDIIEGKTDKLGKAEVTYNPKYSFNGYYSYTVTAYDEKGRKITAQSSFFVGDKDSYYFSRSNDELEIVTDMDSYVKGDSLTAYILLPYNNTELLVTYETDSFLFYKKYKVEGNTLRIREKLTDKFSPSFNITVSFLRDRHFYYTSRMIGVLAKDKFLNISLKPSKRDFKPAEKASYLVSVKNYKGQPVKNAEISLGIVDESIYAIKEDNTPDIHNFFYAPKYSYIPIYNSMNNANYNGRSRPATFVDNHFYEQPSTGFANPGKSSLLGTMLYKNSSKPAAKIYLFLSSNKNFYKAITDTLGQYMFSNVEGGFYKIFISTGDGEIKLIDSLVLSGTNQYDFSVDEASLTNFNVEGEVNSAARTPQYFTADSEFRIEKTAGVLPYFSEKEEYAAAKIRKTFSDAAFWQPGILTDQNGEASISFKMPDNLTTWRATARGVTINTEVGQQTDKIITRKNLLIRMETPRFFREGDRLTISTIVHNYLDKTKKIKISFDVLGIRLIDSKINTPGYNAKIFNNKNNTYELNLDKNSELRIDWLVEVNSPVGEAKLKAEALSNEESDALELKVPVLPKGYKNVASIANSFTAEIIDTTIKFSIPYNIDLRTSNFSFAIAPSLAGTMLKALDDLVGYPYGCVEQTMSRFLPTIIVAGTFKDLNVPLRNETILNLPKMVEAGLKRLYSFQHKDGGWGWWMNDKTHPYMTAYVVYGFSLAKEAGYNVDKNAIEKGIENLTNQLKNYTSNDYTTKAFMLYALTTAGRNIVDNYSFYSDIINQLLSKDINAYALSLVTLSLQNIRNYSTAKNAVKLLEDKAVMEKEFTFWEGIPDQYRWQDDKVQTTAFAVQALLGAGTNLSLIEKAVTWLLNQRQGFSWRSTQETAAVVYAISAYLKKTHELKPDYYTEVLLNGKKLLSKNFSAKDVFNSEKTINISGFNNILKQGTNEIKIIKRGKGKIYLSGLISYFTLQAHALKTEAKFDVEREYYLLNPEEKNGKIIYVKQKLENAVITGQEIFVKTKVKTKFNNLQYFILEDMLPSGFETVKNIQNYLIENEDNNYYYPYSNYPVWRWFYADREYRDNRVVFFVTNSSNEMTFTYIMRAQIPGRYSAAGANAYLMYYPNFRGSSIPNNIMVTN